MRRQQFRDVFSIFFEPRVPVAFLAGSLALGIAGSAAYALLSALLGASLWAQGGLLLSAVLVLLFAAGVIQRALDIRARRRLRGRLTIPERQRMPPRAGLVLPVGLGRNGPELPILEWHLQDATLRHCWLVVSGAVQGSAKLGDLRQWLLERNVEVHTLAIRDPYSLAESYAAAADALRAAPVLRGALPLAVDLTSGTAMMSVGLALAAREHGAAMQYYPARYDLAGKVVPGSAEAPLLVALVETEETP